MTGHSQQDEPRMSRLLIRAIIQAAAKHLPPSASRLRLLDINGAAGEAMSELRGDLDIITDGDQPDTWTLEPDSLDAVVGAHLLYSTGPNNERGAGGERFTPFLLASLRVLRPGG